MRGLVQSEQRVHRQKLIRADVGRRRRQCREHGEQPFPASVRYRTVGDMSCTGAVESGAGTLEAVVAEIAATDLTERGETRADDRVTEAAMEDRKREGYF